MVDSAAAAKLVSIYISLVVAAASSSLWEI
jgi:hypothetical protein